MATLNEWFAITVTLSVHSASSKQVVQRKNELMGVSIGFNYRNALWERAASKRLDLDEVALHSLHSKSALTR